MNKGFTMIEVVFSLSLCFSLMVLMLQGLVLLKRDIIHSKNISEQQIMAIENSIESQFYPVEDIEWVIAQVLQ